MRMEVPRQFLFQLLSQQILGNARSSHLSYESEKCRPSTLDQSINAIWPDPLFESNAK